MTSYGRAMDDDGMEDLRESFRKSRDEMSLLPDGMAERLTELINELTDEETWPRLMLLADRMHRWLNGEELPPIDETSPFQPATLDEVDQLLGQVRDVIGDVPLGTWARDAMDAIEVLQEDPTHVQAIEVVAAAVLGVILFASVKVTAEMPSDQRLAYWVQVLGLPVVVWAVGQLRRQN